VKGKPKSKRAIAVSFIVASLTVVLSSAELHGNHRTVMFAVDAVIIVVTGVFIRRRLREIETAERDAPAE
jgi:hypothetical protein